MPKVKDDLWYMERALRAAHKAAGADEVPVGAVLVKDGKILATDRNRICEKNDPTAHAEMLVLRRGARRLKNERLLGTILYTTVEPCAMCAGAIVLARVAQVCFATEDPKAGAGGSLLNILQHPQLNHRTTLKSGIMQEESRALLRQFFKRKRLRSF